MPRAILILFLLCACVIQGVSTQLTPLPKFDGANAGFTLMLPKQTGLTFTNLLSSDRHLTNQILLNGSGVAAGDVDGDGLCDLFFCGLDSPNALYRNLGNFKFNNITAEAGIRLDHLDCTGANLADIDGDADLDLIVNSVGGGTHILINNGQGKFAASAPIHNEKKGGMSSALADIDGDGDLDLYIANYRTVTLRDQPNTKFNFKLVNRHPVVTAINGKSPDDPEYAGRFTFKVTLGERGGTFSPEENGEPDLFLRNEGNGTFSRIPLAGGIFRNSEGKPLATEMVGWGLSVAFRDLNGDHLPDLYICNDFKSPDEIWINSGKGYFTHLPPLAMREMTLSSMGVDFADLNGDGRDDIFVLDMLSQDHWRRHTQRVDMKPELFLPSQITNQPQYPRNTLFISRPDGTYAEMAYYAGLEGSEWAWTPIFLDVDLDGDEDLLVSNGFERDNMNLDALQKIETLKKQKQYSSADQLRLRRHFPRLATPNVAFKNTGDLRFVDASKEWGFGLAEISQGMALADLDNDGDMDVAINNMNAPAAIYRNNATAPRILAALKGKGKNTHGIGAKIIVETPGAKEQQQEIMAGGRYLSSDQPVCSFAAKLGVNHTLKVLWPSGTMSIVSNVPANTICLINEEGSTKSQQEMPKNVIPLFTDQSKLIDYVAPEIPMNDFGLQPLFPYASSQRGPKLVWVDDNNDGWEDMLVNGAELYKNIRGTNFVKSPPLKNYTNSSDLANDRVADLNGDGLTERIMVAQPGPIRIFSNGKEVTKDFGLQNTSGWWNCVEVADLNGDGKPDIVAGNLGQNSRYDRYLDSGIAFYSGDTNGDGTMEFFEAYGTKTGKLWPLQPLYKLGIFLPELRERFPTMESYARATFQEIHQPYLNSLQKVDLDTVKTTVFLNEGKTFRAVPLPRQAQISPCNAIAVADFNGDGAMDLFLAQNLFSVAIDISRHDAGLGLILLNDGKANFTPLSNLQSGINIYGEQRSAAACDFDHDGRIDLVVGQNAGPLKVFKNISGRPSLKINK